MLYLFSFCLRIYYYNFDRETDLDNVIQINNVFTNVSKGEVAPKDNLQKCFKTEDLDQIIKEVRIIIK
jgi:ribosome maturation protein SDO1